VNQHIKLVGIVNVTPDSFSDGGKLLTEDNAISFCKHLVRDGADIVELGADSTRPGSKCVGVEEEWARIKRIISRIAPFCSVGIDTHHAEIARRALAEGALIINDVSAGFDPLMFEVVAAASAQIILMHSRCSAPHEFDLDSTEDLIARICGYLEARKQKAIAAGIEPQNIILDPGFGAFLSSDSKVSIELIDRWPELEILDSELMIGCSRKGFLKKDGEGSIAERDEASVQVALRILSRLKEERTIYVRAHNVAMHRRALGQFPPRPELVEG
jgi:dihydropteroate synthase